MQATVVEGRTGVSLMVDWRLRCGPNRTDQLTSMANGLTSTPADEDAARDFTGCQADGGLLIKVNTMTLARASPISDCTLSDTDPR